MPRARAAATRAAPTYSRPAPIASSRTRGDGGAASLSHEERVNDRYGVRLRGGRRTIREQPGEWGGKPHACLHIYIYICINKDPTTLEITRPTYVLQHIEVQSRQLKGVDANFFRLQ